MYNSKSAVCISKEQINEDLNIKPVNTFRDISYLETSPRASRR